MKPELIFKTIHFISIFKMEHISFTLTSCISFVLHLYSIRMYVLMLILRNEFMKYNQHKLHVQRGFVYTVSNNLTISGEK